MIFALVTFATFIVLIGGILAVHAWRSARDGYEDSTGFHEGSIPTPLATVCVARTGDRGTYSARERDFDPAFQQIERRRPIAFRAFADRPLKVTPATGLAPTAD